jgi:hypothetical protein
MRTFIQRGWVTFVAAPENVKADDSGLMRVYAELLLCPPSLQRQRGRFSRLSDRRRKNWLKKKQSPGHDARGFWVSDTAAP